MSEWRPIDTYEPSGIRVRIKGGALVDATSAVSEPAEGFVAEYSAAHSAFGPSPAGRSEFWLVEAPGEDGASSFYRYANPTHFRQA